MLKWPFPDAVVQWYFCTRGKVMPSTVLERPITLVRGLFQVHKQADNCWSCAVVIYGSEARFTKVELSRAEMESLLGHFHVKFDIEADNFVGEFINDCPVDKLAEFGIVRRV